MTEPLKFTISYGRTINLGNYESARVDLSIEYLQQEITAEEAFKIVKQKVMGFDLK